MRAWHDDHCECARLMVMKRDQISARMHKMFRIQRRQHRQQQQQNHRIELK